MMQGPDSVVVVWGLATYQEYSPVGGRGEFEEVKSSAVLGNSTFNLVSESYVRVEWVSF